MPVDASLTRLQTALFCGKPVGIDQEVSDDAGINVRSSLGFFQMTVSIGVKGVRWFWVFVKDWVFRA